ncbi:MAG: stage V sporulation protein AD [Clostridia bacterium]|nr:stage V sporulation protein AD [Clostridia bacterium]
MNKIGKQTLLYKNKPCLLGGYAVVGPKEGQGNFGKYFQTVLKDDLFGENSYEAAESKMMQTSFYGAVDDAGIRNVDVDVFVAGDLMNQIVSSSFAARSFDVPYLGMFGACSTMAESMLVGAALVDGGFARIVACATASHFSSVEKQFRYPLELGTQRPPTSQWTVTAAGCSILSEHGSNIIVESSTIGKVVDWDVKDVNNMGAAMAPAAVETLKAHLSDMGRSPDEYDLILTGDLGKLGSEILFDLAEYNGIKLGNNYCDCGQMMYTNEQKTFMGGSGCGCIASVINSYVLSRMRKGELRNVLLIATGALMSTTSSQQGNSIPCIAHAVVLKRRD